MTSPGSFERLVAVLSLLWLAAGCAGDAATPSIHFEPPGPFTGVDVTTSDDATSPIDVAPDVSVVDIPVPLDTEDVPDVSGPDVTPDTGPDGTVCSTDADCEGLGSPPCSAAVCDSVLGVCAVSYAPDGSECNDGDTCTFADQCKGGECTGEQLLCDDDDPCTDDVCDPITGCGAVPNEAPCDDGEACTDGDLCVDGVCEGGANICVCQTVADCAPHEDGDACNGTLACNDGLCEVDPATVPDCVQAGGPCGAGACVPATGECSTEPVADGTPCDDADPCTLEETCSGGACVPATVTDCDDGEVCTVDSCTATGGCTHQSAQGGCEDGDPCTEDDACSEGVCVGGAPLSCDDANPCTLDVCEAGVCGHASLEGEACDDGDVCTEADACGNGLCVPGTPLPCDDGSPCTTDSCSPTVGCVHAPKSGPCDDGDSCSFGDACKDGVCTPTTVVDCADENPCTEDLCTGATIEPCKHEVIASGPCEDGDPCTGGDACQAGTCVPGTLDLCGECAGKPDYSACNDGDPATVVDVCVSSGCVGFARSLWKPGGGTTAASSLDGMAIIDDQVLAIGWRLSTQSKTTTFVAQLAPGQAPSIEPTSERGDTIYTSIHHRVAVGLDGRVSFLSGSGWSTSPGLQAAVKTVPGVGDLTAVWGATVKGATAETTKDLWYIGGVKPDKASPWLARCAREEDLTGTGFKWYCENQSTFEPVAAAPGALWGATAPCGTKPCTPGGIALAVVLGNKLPGYADNVIYETVGGAGSTFTQKAVIEGLPDDRFSSIDGSGPDDVWAVGTKGLLARRTAAGWSKLSVLGSVEPLIDLESVHVFDGRVYAVGERHIYTDAKDAVELVFVTAPTSATQADEVQVTVLSTHECMGADCAIGEDVHTNNALLGVLVHGGAVHVVGHEWSGVDQQAVVYTLILP